MKERPILMNGEMVRAILEGRKTQTRRIVKPSAWIEYGDVNDYGKPVSGGHDVDFSKCPFGTVGDRLWVREAFAVSEHWDSDEGRTVQNIGYKATAKNPDFKGWKPSIHMPRWASRITLEITEIRVERLNYISEKDALAEGIEEHIGAHGVKGFKPYLKGNLDVLAFPQNSFRSLWESINGPGSWDQNPWVWVIEFRRLP